MVLCSLAATSLALAIGAWCKTTTMSLTVLPMVSRRAGARAGAATSLLLPWELTIPVGHGAAHCKLGTLRFPCPKATSVCCSWVAGSGGVPPVWRLLPVTRQPANLLCGEAAPASPR
jgi:hypothetical protein